jgi:AcrR family transcriptional regulator
MNHQPVENPMQYPDVAQHPTARTFPKTVRMRQILDAATTLMVHSGSHDVSMQAIATQANVSVGLIYRYFSTKLDLVQAVIVDVLNDISSRLPDAVGTVEDPIRRIAAAFEAYCRIVDERIDAVVLTYRETKTLDRDGRELMKRLEVEAARPLRIAIADAVDAELIRPVDADLLAMDMLGLANNWALKHWFYRSRVSFAGFVRHQQATILSGVMQPEHRDEYTDLLQSAD